MCRRHAEDLSFPRLSLDFTGYAPIGGLDIKEIYTVPIGRDIAENEAIKLWTSRIPRTKFGADLAKNRCFFVAFESCKPETLGFGSKNGIFPRSNRGFEDGSW